MEWDDHYGALLCAKPPLNLIALPFFPIFYCVKDKVILYYYNRFVCYILYSPIAILVTALFTILNVVLTPIAFIWGLVNLIVLFFQSKSCKSMCLNFGLLLKYIVLTPLLLLISLPFNIFVFFINLFTEPTQKRKINHAYDFSLESIDAFEACVHELFEELETSIHENKDQSECLDQQRLRMLAQEGKFLTHFVNLNIKLQAKLNVFKEIEALIYLNTKQDKNHDLYSHSSIMSRTQTLQTFNKLKAWCQQFADQKTKMIDIYLLKNLFQQMSMKIECHLVAHRMGQFQDERTRDELRTDMFYELITMNSNEISSLLTEDTTML